MVRLLGLAAALTFGAAVHRVAVADEPKGGGKTAPADPTAQVLAKLRQPLALKSGEVSIQEFAALVEKGTGVGVVVNEGAFRDSGAAAAEADGLLVRPAGFKGASAAAVLRLTLAKTDATYLVRRDHLEIVPVSHARREARATTRTDPQTGNDIPPFPLVSGVFKERPLSEALDELAADHDLTVLLSPQAADQRAAFVSARLLNVPADTAVELLALQADLRVVRRGAALLVTSKDHSDGLFNERNDRRRQRIETENLRAPMGFQGQIGFAGNLGNPGGFVGTPAPGAGVMGQPAPGPGAAIGGSGAQPAGFGSGPFPGGLGGGGLPGKIGFSGGYGI